MMTIEMQYLEPAKTPIYLTREEIEQLIHFIIAPPVDTGVNCVEMTRILAILVEGAGRTPPDKKLEE